MFSPINWSSVTKIDNQFAYAKTINTFTGQFSQTETNSELNQQLFYRNGVFFHNNFKILYQAGSAYFGSRGKFLLMNHWKPENDTDVKYFEENFEQSPYPLKELLTNIHFDWNERIFYRVINVSLRKLDIWIDANMDWSFCFGSLARYEIIENNSKLVSITDKDKYVWKNKTIKLNQLSHIEYSKPLNASMAYVVVLDGVAKINSTEVSEDYIAKIESNTITIENVDSPIILIREKYDTV